MWFVCRQINTLNMEEKKSACTEQENYKATSEWSKFKTVFKLRDKVNNAFRSMTCIEQVPQQNVWYLKIFYKIQQIS